MHVERDRTPKNHFKDIERLETQYPTDFSQLYERDMIIVEPKKEKETLRILQFNVLADGLSGVWEKGEAVSKKQFIKVDPRCLEWKYRGYRIVEEILRYEADIITLEECDRFDVEFLFSPQRKLAPFFCPIPPKWEEKTCLLLSSREYGNTLCIVHKRILKRKELPRNSLP